MGDNPIPDTKVPDTQEFFENQSETNALNAKRTFDEFQDISLAAARRSQVNFDQLNTVSLRALNNSVDLQAQINQRIVQSMDDRAVEMRSLWSDRCRHADVANYETWYDLGNPVTTGSGDALRSASYTPNRATDTATAGVAATVPASADVRLIDTVGQLVTQVAGLAALVQQMVAANKPATPAATT